MITVTIGPITKTYVLVETTAPAAYDSFSTLTIEALGPKRWVLIEQEHLACMAMWSVTARLCNKPPSSVFGSVSCRKRR